MGKANPPGSIRGHKKQKMAVQIGENMGVTTTTPFTSPRLSVIKTLPPFPPLNLLQVACHLFQAGCNMVKLGIMKKENIAGDIGSLGIF